MTEIWPYRDLLIQLIRREVVVRYRHSMLGIGWALAQPLGLMLLFSFVFTRAVSVGAIQNLSVPYPLFAYVGLLPWTFFAAGLTGCVSSLCSHRDLVTKVYFPQQILPLASLASAFFDFLVASLVLAGLIAYYHWTTPWQFRFDVSLLALPLVLAIQVLLMVGLGLWLALANLWYRDVKYLFTVGIQMCMFLTNVLYPLPDGGSTAMRLINLANPMVPVISSCRAILMDHRFPDGIALAAAALPGIVLTWSGWKMYRVLDGRFAERV